MRNCFFSFGVRLIWLHVRTPGLYFSFFSFFSFFGSALEETLLSLTLSFMAVLSASSSMVGTTFNRRVRNSMPIRALRWALVMPMVAMSSSLRLLPLALMTRSRVGPSKGRQTSVGGGWGYS